MSRGSLGQVRDCPSETATTIMHLWDDTGGSNSYCCAHMENSYWDKLEMCAREQQNGDDITQVIHIFGKLIRKHTVFSLHN